jgi:hypothetical protein
MKFAEKYDKVSFGAISGLVLPFAVALVVLIVSKGHPSPATWIKRIVQANIVTHVVSLCVFPNVAIFLLYNYLDMLKAVKGVLGMTIFWAALVFIIYFTL